MSVVNIVKKFKEFTFSKSRFISSVIDEEILKSQKFGLQISQEDITHEKRVLTNIIEYLWNNIESCKSNREYQELRSMASYYVDKKLGDLKKKYYELNKEASVKNMYDCHLDNCLSMLFLKINSKLYK